MSLTDFVIPPWVRWVAIALVAAVVGYGGWKLRDMAAVAEVSKLKEAHAEETTRAVNEAMKVQQERFAQERAQATQLSAIDKAELERLKGVQDENSHLHDCLASGACGLRIHVKSDPRPAGGPGQLPQASTGGGVDTGRSAELDESSQRAYLALRDGIATVDAQLRACQSSLKQITGQ